MNEKGVIKYNCNWIEGKPLSEAQIRTLNRWRTRLHNLGLIGAYDNGVGYGNISRRIGQSDQFIISGSNTGRLTVLDGRHYTRVLSYDIHDNKLTCEGPIQASSESLTHAAIYTANMRIKGVIHIHSLSLWQKLIDQVPTTSREVEYGTPEMAGEVTRIVKEAPIKDKGILVMGGHIEGIITFGRTLDEAGATLQQYLS
jgi:L-ribulose-5-phosphate 4-epimerase